MEFAFKYDNTTMHAGASAEPLASWQGEDEDFDSLVSLASQIGETTMAAIALVNKRHTCFKARVGFDREEIAWTLGGGSADTGVLIVPDTSKDERFGDHPLVTGKPHIRFYASVPLITREGILLGHLCIMDQKSRGLSDRQASGLASLGKQIVTLFGLKAQIMTFKRNEEFSRNSEADRKLVADKLDKQKKFYENILNKLPTDIAVFDPGHRYLFVNPGAISKEEYRKFIIGKDDYEYAEYRNRDISVAHSRRAKFLEVKNTGKEIRWEDSLRDPNGNIITHLRRMYPVYDESGELTMVIGFGIDITDRKIMEEKQASLVKQLSAQNTQLIDFCNIVSHNLRAPLVNISMLVEFIEESGDPDEQRLFISKLRPVVENLHNTFNELVESIQIKQDLEVKTEDICLEDCIQRTLEGLQTEINKLDAHIEVDFSKAPVIRYPPKYLHSILHNLVSNSLKYHSPARRPAIELRTEVIDKNIVLSIRDNGLGIDLNKHRDNVFKIGKVFHRHPNAKGFGLFMTKTQVESMGGSIRVESMPDKGTAFFIEFVNQKT